MVGVAEAVTMTPLEVKVNRSLLEPVCSTSSKTPKKPQQDYLNRQEP